MDEKEREMAFTHHGGAAAATEDAARTVLKEAERLFGLGYDEQAHAFRGMAQTLTARAIRERAAQAEYRPQEEQQ